ncbi:MAG: hypothetical protein GX760_01995 [Erysipelothrix sp.]|nr:hypothetical protein [Erysipelothrix sp.]
MTKIILIGNLTEENLSEVDNALAYSGIVYRISLVDQAVIIEGDNDALHNASVALSTRGFIIK